MFLGGRDRNPLFLFYLQVLNMVVIHKSLCSVSSLITHTPLIWNSLFPEGGTTPFPAGAVRMQHGTAVHRKGSTLPGFK